MKIASFKYDGLSNLGDQIQSLAAEQHLPSVDEQLNRDSLNMVLGLEKHFIIMNGWFSSIPQNWPPSEAIEPLFFGFHIALQRGTKERFLQPDSIAYLKRFEPIGCRDRRTRDWLHEKGVDAYYTKCLTLTFPRRKTTPKDGKIYLIDVHKHYPLPKHIRKAGVRLSHGCSDAFGDEVKRAMAKRLLELYRESAALVVTSRLHCAMPCVAMGIPVVYLGKPGDYRTSILEDIGLPVHRYNMPKNILAKYFKRFFYETFSLGIVRQNIWNPQPHNIEDEKANIIRNIREALTKRFPKAEPSTAGPEEQYASSQSD